MITELHFFVGVVILCGLLLSASIGHALSGFVYPGVPAPLLPEGPVRTLVFADAAYLLVCGVLRLLGA